MKIEIDENAALTTTVLGVVAILAVLGGHGCSQVEETRRAALQAGLVEGSVPSTTTSAFVKP
jgi:hypothetical protein